MEKQFNFEELQAIYQLLSRVPIQGNEAKSVALILTKMEKLLRELALPIKNDQTNGGKNSKS